MVKTATETSITAVPIVNVFGFVYDSRYLPDRRDLNRSFPGSASGSLASRLAWTFMREVVAEADIGIDLHTAAPPRTNLSQVRANLDDEETLRLGMAFGAPVIIHGGAPSGSLRGVAVRRGKRVLLFEAGEPHRFNADAIDVGVRGVLNVMAALGMIDNPPPPAAPNPCLSRRTRWVRASQSGIFHPLVELGSNVEDRQVIGRVADPFGGMSRDLRAPFAGIVVGLVSDPRVHRGDAVIHLAQPDVLSEGKTDVETPSP